MLFKVTIAFLCINVFSAWGSVIGPFVGPEPIVAPAPAPAISYTRAIPYNVPPFAASVNLFTRIPQVAYAAPIVPAPALPAPILPPPALPARSIHPSSLVPGASPYGVPFPHGPVAPPFLRQPIQLPLPNVLPAPISHALPAPVPQVLPAHGLPVPVPHALSYPGISPVSQQLWKK